MNKTTEELKITRELEELGIDIYSLYKRKQGWKVFVERTKFNHSLNILKENNYHIVLTTSDSGLMWENPLWIWFFEKGE